ncbi:MAG: CBS domain-containing protein [Pseudomonadota bacterium]|nr:MAG: CBS domain-containing protein [Pseudomonadota bacterium]
MARLVKDVMTTNPIRLSSSAPVIEAAKQMRNADIGAVIVEDDGHVAGIVTDRDIAVRAVAAGKDPEKTPVSDIVSRDLATLSPNDDLERAVKLMREKAIRRIPVIDGGRAVGIVSLGDLAIERDASSALGQISAAPPNQ